MAYPVMPLGFLGSQGDQDTYRIERSLRFNSADSDFLNRTFSSGNRRLWTWSGWIKRTTLGTIQRFFTCRTASNDNDSGEIGFADDAIQVSGWGTVWRKSSALLRDPSSWYHFVVTIDTANATANNRIRVYLNGVELTSFSTLNNPSVNADLGINQAAAHRLGVADYGDYANFYLAEVNFIDGQALTPSSFGETDAITGRWKAKAYSGTYGTNGFYLKFADNSGTTATTLGKDSSGNGNNWTPNNFSVTAGAGNDSLVDSPTNYGTDTGVGGEVRGNYATLNPLATSGGTLLNGNLEYDGPSAWRASPSTILIPSTGKWYFEGTLKAAPASSTFGGAFAGIGVIQPLAVSAWSYNSGTSLYLTDTGHISNYNVGSTTSFTGNASGTVISLAIDRDANTVTFYQNGVSKSVQTIGVSSGSDLYAFIGSYSSSNGQFTANFGQRPFAYTAPSGFKALCSTNISKDTAITTSGSFTGNASADGPYVWLNGTPTTMTINGNAVTFGTHADRLAGGFKIRSSMTSYNTSGSNTFSVSTTDKKFKYARAQ